MNIRLLLVGLLIGAVLMLYASYKASIKPYSIQKVRTMPVLKQVTQTIVFGFKAVWSFLFFGIILFLCFIVIGWLMRLAG